MIPHLLLLIIIILAILNQPSRTKIEPQTEFRASIGANLAGSRFSFIQSWIVYSNQANGADCSYTDFFCRTSVVADICIISCAHLSCGTSTMDISSTLDSELVHNLGNRDKHAVSRTEINLLGFVLSSCKSVRSSKNLWGTYSKSKVFKITDISCKSFKLRSRPSAAHAL